MPPTMSAARAYHPGRPPERVGARIAGGGSSPPSVMIGRRCALRSRAGPPSAGAAAPPGVPLGPRLKPTLLGRSPPVDTNVTREQRLWVDKPRPVD